MPTMLQHPQLRHALFCASKALTRPLSTMSASASVSVGASALAHPPMSTAMPQGKKEGDISSVFVGLSGAQFTPLEPRFATVKAQLLSGHEDAMQASWERLLRALREQVPAIAALGPAAVPSIDFADLDKPTPEFTRLHRERGVAVVRGVLPSSEALALKEETREYIRANPATKAFPVDNPQVYELYWSPSQIRARAHPNMLKTQAFLLQHWHSRDDGAHVSTTHPVTYADRLRIRVPGDNKFKLGPHVDGGSVERFEAEGYGRGGVYDDIFAGNWEKYDPFELSCRLPVQSDLYAGAGACSMFRAYQGWLSLSDVGPGEGTLLVNPMLRLTTAYMLLRPFFEAKQSELHTDAFLHPSNWRLKLPPDSWLHGASPGHGQELTTALHPHLDLARSMVHVPRVAPGDYVAWHCDSIHAVDAVHNGVADSSVMYIPACPLTDTNAAYLARQRAAFLAGVPAPDFPGGVGETNHRGRPGVDFVQGVAANDGLMAMGLAPWPVDEPGLTDGQRAVMQHANALLDF